MILTPDSKMLRLYLFTDADFVELFAAEDKHDPVSVESGTEVLLNLGGAHLFEFKIVVSGNERTYISSKSSVRIKDKDGY